MFGVPVATTSCAFLLAHEAMGAACTRHSQRPCVLKICQNVQTGGSDQPPVAGTEPVAPKGREACKRARDSSGVFLNPNSCTGFEPEPSKEGNG
jgi:hypothetical protein